jgi:hypothetical protein
MATHRFAINVPNPAARAATVELALQPVTGGLSGTGVTLPQGNLDVERAWISLDPCGAEGHRTLELYLQPRSSATVTVTIVTTANPKGGTAAFELVDRRSKRIAGGVTLACVDPPLKQGPPRTIPTDNPCPVVLASNPYPVGVNANPGVRPARPSIALGAACDLVAPLTNPNRVPLADVRAYLEHLGTSGAGFTPTSWNIGTLAPGEIFYATWRAWPGQEVGTFECSIVVASQGREATRLHAPVTIGP